MKSEADIRRYRDSLRTIRLKAEAIGNQPTCLEEKIGRDQAFAAERALSWVLGEAPGHDLLAAEAQRVARAVSR